VKKRTRRKRRKKKNDEDDEESDIGRIEGPAPLFGAGSRANSRG